MKKLTNLSVTCILAFAFASCGGSGSSGLFGDIPSTIASYDKERQEIESKMDANNFAQLGEKVQDLKQSTIAKVEKEATELNGKEIPATTDEAILKIESPVTLVFKEMNGYRAMFGLDGKVVAAEDLPLNADSSDLKGESLMSGAQISVSVKKAVGIEFLDKEGNVVHSRTEIGVLPAENLGTSAVVKAGTPINFNSSFAVDELMVGVESIRLVCNLSEAPYFSRSLN